MEKRQTNEQTKAGLILASDSMGNQCYSGLIALMHATPTRAIKSQITRLSALFS